MAINQKQVLSLQQKLSPQQIQMIKLLELPAVQLEHRINQEIEENIVLEEEEHASDEEEQPQQISVDEYLREDDTTQVTSEYKTSCVVSSSICFNVASWPSVLLRMLLPLTFRLIPEAISSAAC